ncbi:MAG: heparinase II/III-family protein [Planctomycetes bacterium]|nr:heparinase II/III-family protein [Planctomycetota bacterium]
MRQHDIEQEVRRRAEGLLEQNHLLVDYYRVRRRLALPLPVRAIYLAGTPMPGKFGRDSYPWATWATWALEERIGCLGWSAAWNGDTKAKAAAAADLDALAEWPAYRQYDKPDLSQGHASRTLWSSYAYWDWLPAATKTKIEGAFERIVDDVWPLSEKIHGAFADKDDILADEKAHGHLHNIPLIGTAGMALAAAAIDHPRRDAIDRRMEVLFGALLDLRERGHSEGVAYDGYLLDFFVHWLETLPPERRALWLDHPRFDDCFHESYRLAAPGDRVEVPEIGDVEPVEMPFHLDFHAKTCALRPDPLRAWFLDGCRLERFRAAGLAALHAVEAPSQLKAPKPGALDAYYALALRTGWERDDVAVVASCTASKMGHLHDDSGSIVIGTAGTWVLADPGYQQYLQTSERPFTLGTAAHNAPVIDGHAQSAKAAKRLALQDCGNGLLRLRLDLRACYPAEVKTAKVLRTVWLAGKEWIVVADEFEGERSSVAYHWTGHRSAAWWVDENWARIVLPTAELHFTSPQAKIADTDFARLKGSRGHMTLKAEADAKAPVVWWCFRAGARRDGEGVELADGGRALKVAGRTLQAGD